MTPIDIYAYGKRYHFEWHHWFGPSVVNRRTWDVLDRQPGEKSPFWPAVEAWDRQGRRVKDGVAAWNREHAAEFELIHLGGRHYEQGRMVHGERCEVATG